MSAGPVVARCACLCSCPYDAPDGALTCLRCRAGDHTRAQGLTPEQSEREFRGALISVLASVREALLKQEATAREMLEFMKERMETQ